MIIPKVDPIKDWQLRTNLSLDNLEQLSDEQLLHGLSQAFNLGGQYGTESGTTKTLRNSIYGATSNPFYEFCRIDCAEDITAEGRYYIQFADKVMNTWLQQWHLETDLHRQLRSHEKLRGQFLQPDLPVTPLEPSDRVVYIDTDSVYVTMEDVITSIRFTGDNWVEFLIILNELRLKRLFRDALVENVEARFGENFLKFDLENISQIGFFDKKKKYLLALKWEDAFNQVYDSAADHLKGKGIELAQNSFSPMAIKMIKSVLKRLVDGQLTNQNYQHYLTALWQTWSNPKVDINQLCKFSKFSKLTYEKYIERSDASGWVPRKGALAQYKAAARYNHLVLKHGLQNRYELIQQDGSKFAWYLDNNGEYFGFQTDDLPSFAPEPNRLIQFEKQVARPLARLVRLTGIDVNIRPDRAFSMPSL